MTRQVAPSTDPEQGDHGRLGPAGPETADALSEGFADATRWSLFVAAGFLAVGLATATRLQHRRPEDDDAAATATA